MAETALACLPRLGGKPMLVTEPTKRIYIPVGYKDDTPTIPAIATIRTTPWHILLVTTTDSSVSAGAADNDYVGLINHRSACRGDEKAESE